MAKIMVDDRTEAAIKAAKGPFELCGQNGEIIAVASPGNVHSYPIVIEEPPLPTDEELREILKGPRFSSAQVLAELEAH